MWAAFHGPGSLADLGTGRTEAFTVTPPVFAAVSAIALSRDGKTLAAGFDEIIRVWPVTGPQPKDRVERIQVVAFAPNGESLATGSREGLARLWDLGGAEPRAATELRQELPLRAVTFASDGKTLAVQEDGVRGFTGPRLFLWDLKKDPPKRPATIGGDTLSIWQMCFRTDGDPLAVVLDESMKDRPLKLYSVRGGKLEEQGVLAKQTRVGDVAFAADGKSLAVGAEPGGVTLWDLTGPKPRKAGTVDSGELTRLALAPDGATLAAAEYVPSEKGHGGTATVRLWDVRGGKAKEVAAIRAHTELVGALAFAPDGRSLATAGDDGRVVIWDAAGKKLHEWRLPLPVRGLAFAPDGRHLALVNGDGTAYILRPGK
jgi:WD40 repeat protein